MSQRTKRKDSETPRAQPTLLRLKAVTERTGLQRSSIYSRIKTGEFPAPAKVTGSTISVWSSVEVQEWIDQQLAQPRALAG